MKTIDKFIEKGWKIVDNFASYPILAKNNYRILYNLSKDKIELRYLSK